MSNPGPSRREFLSLLGATGIVGLSGCSESAGDTTATSTSSKIDNVSPTSSPSATPTPVDDIAPSIIEHEALPINLGTKLDVLLRGEDNREIAYAAISYGERILEAEPDDQEVELEGVLEDIPDADPTIPGQVLYILRDNAGNEAENIAYADQTAPTLSFESRTATDAGELMLRLAGHDEVGLHRLKLELNGEPAVTEDLSGQAEFSIQQTVTSSRHNTLKLGELNSVEAVLEDAMGNSTRKRGIQYLRKYDQMENTRLSFGTVYQPYHGFKAKMPENCREERTPSVGQYNRPIPFEILNRHIDQMTGHGINRVMIEFLGNETGYHDKRFLKSDLIDQISVEPFYTAASNLWREGYWSTADSYKEDLVEPHMTFMRDNILSRDNVTSHEGRPVIQMWNAYTWARDYEHDRIMDEWGSYNNFFDDIRSLLAVDGKNPFFVGGTNWWGHDGYPGGRKAELSKQFDATTTWMVGSELHDGFASQEDALEWVEENWNGHREFTDANSMEFVPMVFPGFNEQTASGEACYGRQGRRIPRSPEFFDQLLELAEKYRTTELVNNSVYNNWVEATHIEPGIFEPGPFGVEDYGTSYLDVVKDFQSR